MIHSITVPGRRIPFHVVRFPTEKCGDARLMFGLLADQGLISITDFFAAAKQIKEIEERNGMDMEAIKLRWTRAGFSPAILGNENEWQVTLYHSFPSQKLHRPPTGRGNTLKDAFDAAEADLGEMLAKAKV